MHVWLDLANSPHPLLFAPIAKRLEERGHRVSVTVRDHAQTVPLAQERWQHLTIFGAPSPYGRVGKARAIASRIADLYRWGRTERPDVALSHNSYAQIVAARALRIPVVTAMDYEHQPINHLAFRLASRILLPEALPIELVRRFGATRRKTRSYSGFKEEAYIGDFEFDTAIVRRLDLPLEDDGILVVARTEPSRATYHHFGNPLFADALRHFSESPNVQIAVMPRFSEEGDAIRELRLPRVTILDRAVDARSLMLASDLFVGGGGTMTREAALLGVPAVSVYAGERPAVDRALERRGLVRYAESVGDLPVPYRRERDPKFLEAVRQRGLAIVDEFVLAAEAAAR